MAILSSFDTVYQPKHEECLAMHNPHINAIVIELIHAFWERLQDPTGSAHKHNLSLNNKLEKVQILFV